MWLGVRVGVDVRLKVAEVHRDRTIRSHVVGHAELATIDGDLRVHEAVLRAGEKESGCTVHLADDEYDHGPILAQRRVPVLAGDTPETLAARVAVSERELYPEVIAQIAARGVEWLKQHCKE